MIRRTRVALLPWLCSPRSCRGPPRSGRLPKFLRGPRSGAPRENFLSPQFPSAGRHHGTSGKGPVAAGRSPPCESLATRRIGPLLATLIRGYRAAYRALASRRVRRLSPNFLSENAPPGAHRAVAARRVRPFFGPLRAAYRDASRRRSSRGRKSLRGPRSGLRRHCARDGHRG